jgi:hypothetical protein
MLVHEEKVAYNPWFRVIAVIPVGLFIASIIFAGKQEFEPFLTLLGDAVIFTLIFYCVLPRKYQIYEDRLRIVLGAPFAINIPLSTIKEIRHSSGFKAFFYSGVRFATSTGYIVEIVRNKGMNYVITPRNGDLFIDFLDQAVKNAGRNPR